MNKESHDTKYLMDYAEQRSDRYMEAEQCLLEIATMPIWALVLFGRKKALNHIKQALKKYNF